MRLVVVRTFLAFVLVLGAGHSAPAAPLDAAGVLRGAKGLLPPNRLRGVKGILAASDRTVWVVGIDWNGRGGRRDWYIRHLGSDGSCLRGNVQVLLEEEHGMLNHVTPVGTLPDGRLAVDIEEETPEATERLATLTSGGTTATSDIMPSHGTGAVFVDMDGIAHLTAAVLSPVDYAQVDMTSPDFPVIRALDYNQPFDSLARVPDYLRWHPLHRGGPADLQVFSSLAFHSQRPGEMLVATMQSNRNPRFYIRRINTETLALLDSGSVHPTQDAIRMWSGPRITRTTIVPAADSGYWLFIPMPDTPPAPTVVACRVDSHLKAISPSAAEECEPRPFTDSPEDAVVSIEAPFRPYKHIPAGDVCELVLEFAAFDRDGQLYAETLSDTILMRWREKSKPDQ